ncbi:MAG: class I SAM-dependent methyltransferase [Alphaproteobacteria bacterium]|nr:class I SAM-dependent methyltransferase [Alphaproteobacteria bacterium]
MRTYALMTTALSLTIAAAIMPSRSHAAESGPIKVNVAKAIAAAVADTGRKEVNRARDVYRHPAETLTFFGVKPTDIVVEIWPGGGWYSEILGPLTQDQGQLYLAAPERGLASTKEMIAAQAGLSHAIAAVFPNDDDVFMVPNGVADIVLTFRNVHNWRFGGIDNAKKAFEQMYAMLKPGGTLGVVDHRLPEEMDSTAEEKSGYMKKSSVIAFARAAGFELAGEIDINANPKDSHDWPDGVWTLPPVLRKGDVNRDTYLAIGESDRMTLKFRKPAN